MTNLSSYGEASDISVPAYQRGRCAPLNDSENALICAQRGSGGTT